MPEIKLFNPSEDFVESISEQVNRLRMKLSQDEDFIGEVAFGPDLIEISHIGVAGQGTVRLIGMDSQKRECHLLAHIASLNILFRIRKTTAPEEKRTYGFIVDTSHE
jgi:hypothetical protein